MTQRPKRQYIHKERSSLKHYRAGAFVVRCVDNRFWKVIKHFIKGLGFEHIDPKSPAGGAKVFSSPVKKGDRDYYLRELEISIRLHHVDRVMLFTHHDCGAYGGFSAFKTEDGEFRFHKSEHKKAAQVIKKRFPGLKVNTYFVDDRGIIKTS